MPSILSRLPWDSLLRFKFVSKSQYALINDPALQFKRVLLNCLMTMNSGENKIIFSILKFALALDRHMYVLNVDFPFYADLEIHSHSHGLVCLSDGADIFLCNPTTREFRKIPPSISLLTEPPSELVDFFTYPKTVGFGYDSKSRDFKLVRAVEFLDESGHFDHKRMEANSS